MKERGPEIAFPGLKGETGGTRNRWNGQMRAPRREERARMRHPVFVVDLRVGRPAKRDRRAPETDR
jgi:hypothetical protein